jgi:hypothetical protein
VADPALDEAGRLGELHLRDPAFFANRPHGPAERHVRLRPFRAARSRHAYIIAPERFASSIGVPH